jgi:hypothetical protein
MYLGNFLPDLEVVSGAACGVEKDIVGLADRHEARLGAGILVAIRVIPERQGRNPL